MVVTSLPSIPRKVSWQERRAFLSTITVQAPQSPILLRGQRQD